MGNKIEKILPLVQRPSRYTNGEWNAIKPKENAAINYCLCFPDLYEIGASNLGLEILYHIINHDEQSSAQRCFAPAQDLEVILRAEKIPLFSLETQNPLNNFDVIGFGLQYELCASNVLNMLDLAGIPIFCSQRGERDPIILGGGPVTANPEPLSDFFDAFVLGDGEEVICEITQCLANAKNQKFTREQKLFALSQIFGVYIPSLYEVSYNEDGTLAKLSAIKDGVPSTVHKRSVDVNNMYFPSKQLVPFVNTVHNRLNIEIARGCPRRCRFCQAAKYYYPWRVRTKEKVLELVDKGLAQTGYEEVALSSLSCTDHKELEEIISEINTRHSSKRISISLPSLRCDQFSIKVAAGLGEAKRMNLTFAPEAGSDRLRNIIGKDLNEQQIFDTLLMAWECGWRQIKLYFMTGLPFETQADITAIVALVNAVRAKARNLNFTVTISPFVPKAQTAFQWVPMEKAETLSVHTKRLRATLPAAVKAHQLDGSIVEALLARGDRRLGQVIFSAWKLGCKFDQWKEYLRFDLWQEALKQNNLTLDFYVSRERGENEVLPWEHLIFSLPKEKLLESYKESKAIAQSEDAIIPVGSNRPAKITTASVSAPKAFPFKTVQRTRLKFARKGTARFISHLEQIEFFRRALRRTALSVSYTQGFSPQPKISFGPAISVGYESYSEYIEVEFYAMVELAELKSKVLKELPGGFNLLSLKNIPVFFPSVDALANTAEYSIELTATEEKIKEFLQSPEIPIVKEKDGKIITIDAKPLIRELKIDGNGVIMQLRFGPKKNIKPEKIMQKLFALSDYESRLLKITRTALYVEKSGGLLSEL